MSKVDEQSSQGWIQAIRNWNQKNSQVYHLLLPVFANLMLTLAAWIYVYEMRVEKSPISTFFFDRSNEQTTGNDFYDGMLNGFVCVASVGVLSFVMLGFALYDFRRLIQCWLSLSCLLIMFCVASSFFAHLLAKFNVDNAFLLAAITMIYGTIGSLAFFTNKLPLIFHQLYVVSNCSLVSLFYLQILPNHTTWFLLAGIVAWDIFAVLTPLGPLRQVTDKAQDYHEDVLRFLMFSTAVEEVSSQNHVENSTIVTETTILKASIECSEEENVVEWQPKEDFEFYELSDNCEQSQSDERNESKREACETEEIEEVPLRTAQDALNDSSARLGMGDFVFYSLLVGKAAVSGSVLATAGAIIGVIVGLVVTLTVLTDGDETTPALPVSIFFGMTLHFGILHVLEPLLHAIFA